MKNLPHLTEADIRPLATDQSWTRGEDYYYGSAVGNLVWRAGVLTAEVGGSAYEPYIVQVRFAEGKIQMTHCTCPYDWDGDCKHIIAVLLYLCHRRDEIEQRPALADLLADLTREQLVDILLDLSAAQPAVIDEIERSLVRVTPGKPAGASSGTPAIDERLLRRQIRAELRASIKSGYDSWGESAFYDSDLGAALDPALTKAQAYLDEGEPRAALATLEIAAMAWEDGIDSLDEYVRESFEEVAAEFTFELGLLWAEALLTAALSAEEQLEWQDKLEDFAALIYGGASLEIAVTAAEQGWTYPPLAAAMQGQITEKGAWEAAAPDFADDLARIRLRILSQRGQFQAYLNLAQAEGQFMLYLHMLINQGQSAQALSEARQYIVVPEHIHALAHTLFENGETEQAFELAKHGLGLDETQGKAALAAWLRDQARAHGQSDLALEAARRAFAENITRQNYQGLQQAAGSAWQNLRAEALEITAQGKFAEDKVEIYLYEKMYQQAIETVDQAAWVPNLDQVIEAVKAEYPRWAFRQCQQHAEAIMDAGRAQDYRTAAEWLRRGRAILVSTGDAEMWASYLDQIMDKHQRKYKLMPMLRELGSS